MPDWGQTLLDLLSQFTGERAGAHGNIVSFVLAGILWAALLAISSAQQREVSQPTGALLRWGFAVSLGRELLMLGLRISHVPTVGSGCPPICVALSSIALVTLAAGFMRFLSPGNPMAGRYLRFGIGISIAIYLTALASWVFLNPAADVAIWRASLALHTNAAALSAFAAIWLSRNSKGRIRNGICAAFTLLFGHHFLKLSDLELTGAYTLVLQPVSQMLYLLAIPLFFFVYLQEMVAQRVAAELRAAELAANLERRVLERTRELEKANAWKEHAESIERARIRQALMLQHVLFDLAREDKSDLPRAMRSLLRAVGSTLKVGRVSFWTVSPALDFISCRCLYTDATGAFSDAEVVLRAETFPAYFRAIQRLTQIIADDARAHDDTREFTEAYLVPLGITSMMDIPVWQHGSLAGILCCEHIGRARVWGQPEVDFATAVSDMLSFALESADRRRAEHALSLERSRQAAIVELEAAINREDELQAVLNRIAATVTELLPATAASVLLWDAATETFTLSSTTVPGQPMQAGARRVRRTGGASRAIVDTRAPVSVPDISKDPFGANSLLDQFGMHSYVGVPLLAADEAHGVLYAIDRDVRDYTPQEVAFLGAVASCAATALMKFRLFESLKETNLQLANEVAERRRAEVKINASLREKEALLQEVHHRVKNNLQIVSSLLNLQSRDHSDQAIRAAFADSQHRIRSMALIHEMLYQTEHFAEIEFGAYLRTLLPALIRGYCAHGGRVTYEIDADPLPVRTELAVPLGLIFNELIANSLKHAFPNRPDGRISIGFHRVEGQALSLTVRDNGVGLPPDFSVARMNSLGLRLVGMMAGQIDGHLEARNDGGACFTLTFEMQPHALQSLT